jgi:outer membrane protein W
MKTSCLLLLVAFAAAPAFAQHGIDLLLDAEGVRRTGETTDIASGTQQLTPDFSNGWGAGAGLNVWLSDRFSIEGKASGFRSRLHVTTVGSDFVGQLDLGHARLYPIMAVLQWHPMEHGMLRPYIGAGVAHIILENVNEEIGNSGARGIEFNDPTGLLLDAGLRIHISNKWDAFGDIRYVPVETRGETTFPGTEASVRLEVKPLIAGFGVAYRF